MPSIRGRGFPRTPGLFAPEQASAWKPIVAAVHDKGGKFFAQPWHVGRIGVPSQTGGLRPLASVETKLPGKHELFGALEDGEKYVPSQAMSEGDMEGAIGEFVAAARGAVEAGSEGVEIHGANGYLLDTFVHSNINTRADQYGGSLENRLRFPLRLVSGVAEAIGASRTAVRLAPFHVLKGFRDANPVETFTAYCSALDAMGLAYVHLVEPRYDVLGTENAYGEKKDNTEMKHKEEDLTLWPFREALRKTTAIGAGGYDGDSARQALREGRVDLVAMGRWFTSNPDLLRRLVEGRELVKYDRKSFYTEGMEGYLGWSTVDGEPGRRR